MKIKIGFYVVAIAFVVCLSAKPSAACSTKDFDDDVTSGCGDSSCQVQNCAGYAFLQNKLMRPGAIELRIRHSDIFIADKASGDILIFEPFFIVKSAPFVQPSRETYVIRRDNRQPAPTDRGTL